ncbi:hypothetical protein F2Q69_00006930 [Brassica cretica]|uniref:Uncharacterized protein n=1 Tax=Brassica cretica TaxID=69181 RepID=A0A8S9NQC5_BRACR|nr:hypothetical protein F2Q69_00006930 [Brassica cretica]
MDSCRIDVLGEFDRYVVTEPWLELGRYVTREVPTLRWARPPPKIRFWFPPLRRQLASPASFPSERNWLVAKLRRNQFELTPSFHPLLLWSLLVLMGLSPLDRLRLRFLSRTKRRPLNPCLLLRLGRKLSLRCVPPVLLRSFSLRAGSGGAPRAMTGSLRSKEAQIDGMISECGSEASRLARDLSEIQGKWSETEAMLKANEGSHSAKRQIESDEGSTSRGVEEAKDSLRVEFQARLAKISCFLGSLECIRSRELALATVEGRMAVVRALQSETPPSLQATESRLSDCKGDLAAVDGDFDLVLADLKSACFLPKCSEDPEGKDPVVRKNGGDTAPILDEAMGEEGV